MRNIYTKFTGVTKAATLLFALMMLAVAGFSQASAYTFAQSNIPYAPIVGTTLGVATNDDTSFPNIAIPFTFTYNGVGYNAISVQSNGFIAMGTTIGSSYTPISTGATNNIIAAFGRDIQGSAANGASLQHGVVGSFPNRTYVVQWTGYAKFSATGTGLGDNLNFQIRLNETSNTIDITYGTMVFNANTNTVQVGLRGATNADFNNRTSTVNWNTTTAGAANNATITMHNSVTVPASGLNFRYTPPTFTAPPTCPTTFVPANGATNVTFASPTLSWSGAVGAASYDVYFGTSAVPPLVSSNQAGTTYVTPVLLGNTTYFWRVNSINPAGTTTCAVNSFTTSTPLTGDLCSNAEPITCNTAVSGTTVGYTTDLGLPTCNFSSGTSPGRWYVFTPATSGLTTVGTCSDGGSVGTASFDTKIHVFRGTCNGLICVGSDDDACTLPGLSSVFNFTRTGGQTYYILVSGFGTATGTYTMTLDCVNPPANDNPCLAMAGDPLYFLGTPTGVATTRNFDLRAATADPGEINPGTGAFTYGGIPFGGSIPAPGGNCNAVDGWCSTDINVQNSVWYAFVGPASGQIEVFTTGGNSQVAIYTASTNCLDYTEFTEVWANDNQGPLSAGQLGHPCLGLPVTSGQPYYIQVDGFQGAGVIGQISVRDPGAPQGSPVNDFCSGALPITIGGTVTGNTICATVDNQATCVTTDGTGGGVWYTFVGDGSKATLSFCSNGGTANYDSKIRVFTGSCNALTCVTGNDDFCGLQSQTPAFCTTPGQVFYVLVHGFGSAVGTFTLSLTSTPGPSAAVTTPTVNCGFNISCNGGNDGSISFDLQNAPACPPYANPPITGGCTNLNPSAVQPWGTFSCPSGSIGISYGGEYSNVNVTTSAVIQYTSSFPTDIVTLTDINNNILANGIGSVTYQSNFTGVIRFWTHNPTGGCGIDNSSARTRSASCICNPGSAPSYVYSIDGGVTYQSSHLFTGLAAGTYNLSIIRNDGCQGTGTVTLTQPDPLVATSCNDQNVTLGYQPLESAIITANTTGGCNQSYSYSWDNGLGAGQTHIVRPAVTTTYTVTVTDANNCSTTETITVNVVDVRCAGSKVRSGGSKMGRIAMCGGTGSNGPRNKCVKAEDVSKKLCQGYTLGACGSGLDFSGGDCGDPDYLSCKCYDGVSKVCYTYSGANGATVVLANDAAGNQVLATFTNVNSGDVLCVDSIPANLGSHGSHGGSHGCGSHGNVFKKKMYARVNGGAAVRFGMKCGNPGSHGSHNADRIMLGTTQGSLTLTSYTDGTGAICNAAAPPICACSGKITALRLTYMGPNGADVKIYKSNNHSNMIWSGVGLNTFSMINLANPAGLPGKIYIEIVGSGMPDVVVDVKCGQLFVADRYYYFDIAAYKSAVGGSCPTGVLKSDDDAAAASVTEGLTAYPNPFNDATTVEFSVAESQNVKVEVYNITGVRVATLFDGLAEASSAYKLSFRPESAASGIYFARMTMSDGTVKTEKLVLNK